MGQKRKKKCIHVYPSFFISLEVYHSLFAVIRLQPKTKRYYILRHCHICPNGPSYMIFSVVSSFFPQNIIHDTGFFLCIWESFLTKLQFRPQTCHSYLFAKKISKLWSVYVIWDLKLAFQILFVKPLPFRLSRQMYKPRMYPTEKNKKKQCPHASIFSKRCLRI